MSSDAARKRVLPLRFIFVATAVIALLHVYIGLRLVPDLALGAYATGAAVALLALSTALIPVGLLARAWSQHHSRPLLRVLVWAGLIVTGHFSSLLVLTIARDLLLLPTTLFLGYESFGELAQDSAIAVPLLSLFFTAIGFANAQRTARVVRVDVPIAGLPAALANFTITQISDIHVGPTIGRAYVERIVAAVNALGSDLIAVTGDLVDGSVADLAASVAPLAKLAAPHGVYFVTGNHEYYSGAAPWVQEIQRLGIVVLQNEHVVIEHGEEQLVVAGVTDFSAAHFDAAQKSDPHEALRGAPRGAAAKILLAHQPRSANAAATAGFDLQLSGHTHGGQFFPWNFFVRFQQPWTAGLHRLNAMWVYISRGTGYWGPPKRLGAPAEITRLRLVAA
jgi:predicted MPP superfamily phosphohydrolase